MRVLVLSSVVLTAALSAGRAEASCPSGEPVLDELTCSSTISGHLNYTDTSDLGGSGATQTYSCGTYAPLSQLGMEDVYSFTCQRSGSVTLNITGLDCDLDIYILDDTCDPHWGCVAASDLTRTTSDSVSFTCATGATYYVVNHVMGGIKFPIAFFGAFYIPDAALWWGIAVGTGTSLLGSIGPAWSARAVRVAEIFAKVA